MNRSSGNLLLALLSASSVSFISEASALPNCLPQSDAITVAIWRFDRDADDSSPNGLNGTLVGGTSFVGHPRFHSALRLDGSTGYVTVPHSPLTSFGLSSFSLECWFRTTSPAVQELILKEGHGGGERDPVYVLNLQDNGLVRFAIRTSATAVAQAFSQSRMNDGCWHHVLAVRDRTAGEIRLYVDTILQQSASDAAVGAIDPTDALVIGRRNIGPENYFDGDIDEVRISNAVREPPPSRCVTAGPPCR